MPQDIGPTGATRARRSLVAMTLTVALAGAGCVGGNEGSNVESGAPTIPQPVVPDDLPTAPDGERVDLQLPTFSDPTTITNPLFPVSLQESVLLLGRVDGEAFRTEVTLLPDTRIIEWAGQNVEVLVSQYVAYLDGRIQEVAYDLYAQDDGGSVWYFGEDVFNFADGVIVDTHGTWIAGKDGPAAMIMPAEPKVGDVYRPENIPGFVFEEVVVTAVGEQLDGPLGAIHGGLLITEFHMDGTTEGKTFAPGYGEFFTSGGGDTEALAMAVPTDAASGPVPAELETLEAGALRIFDAAGSGDWDAASAELDTMTAAWESYPTADVPRLVEPLMSQTFASFADAVGARDAAGARQAAIDTARWSLDLQLRYRPAVEVDLARMDLWAAQILVDAEAGDAAGVNGDFFSIDYVRDRVMHVVSDADGALVNIRLEELLGTIGDGDLDAAAAEARRLREILAGIEPTS